MKKLFLLLASIGLSACATAYRNEGDLESKESYLIECRDVTSACFSKAAEVCPKGYETKKISAVGATSLILFPTQLRSIEINCKI